MDPRKTTAARKARLFVLSRDDHCYLCGGYVDKTLWVIPGAHTRRCRGVNKKGEECGGCAPHPLRPEVDHVYSLALGGDPSNPENLALTHRIGNLRKGKKPLSSLILENFNCLEAAGFFKAVESETDWLGLIEEGDTDG